MNAIRTPLWIARFVFAALRERSGNFLRFQPGYHGSTIPSARFVSENRERLFNPPQHDDGIDLNRDQQLALLQQFLSYLQDFQPPEEPTEGRLYHYANSMFGFSDAFVLYSFLRAFQPRRVIEVGSGYSSALMLDTARDMLPTTSFAFIDPYSQTIRDVLSKHRGTCIHHTEQVQDIPLDFFGALDAGDVLFLDTSHAVKIGSDVSYLLFQVLPALKPGVLVHLHDIFWPWEYPEDFVMAGRTYNEVYFVRAFLQYNDAFEILFNSSQMEVEHRDLYPAGYFDRAGVKTGQSLWLRKVKR